MTPIRLTAPEGQDPKATVGWLCSHCRVFWPEGSHCLAETCCIRTCQHPGCTTEVRGSFLCGVHSEEASREAREKKFRGATHLKSGAYEGPVYWPDSTGGSYGEGYFESIQEVLDHCDDEGVPLPKYVWACTSRAPETDARNVIESALEEFADEATDRALLAKEELQKHLDAWWKSQEITGWFADFTRAVLLDDE